MATYIKPSKHPGVGFEIKLREAIVHSAQRTVEATGKQFMSYWINADCINPPEFRASGDAVINLTPKAADIISSQQLAVGDVVAMTWFPDQTAWSVFLNGKPVYASEDKHKAEPPTDRIGEARQPSVPSPPPEAAPRLPLAEVLSNVSEWRVYTEDCLREAESTTGGRGESVTNVMLTAIRDDPEYKQEMFTTKPPKEVQNGKTLAFFRSPETEQEKRDVTRYFLARIERINTGFELSAWRKKHAEIIASLGPQRSKNVETALANRSGELVKAAMEQDAEEDDAEPQAQSQGMSEKTDCPPVSDPPGAAPLDVLRKGLLADLNRRADKIVKNWSGGDKLDFIMALCARKELVDEQGNVFTRLGNMENEELVEFRQELEVEEQLIKDAKKRK